MSLTPTQAQTAVENPNNYALCVLHKSGEVLTKEYVRAHAKFVINIGTLIQSKVIAVTTFNNSKNQLFNANEDVGLLLENTLDYKYKISTNIWSKGMSLDAFAAYIKSKI